MSIWSCHGKAARPPLLWTPQPFGSSDEPRSKVRRPMLTSISYTRHRFPADVIRQSVWLYFRFALSFRDVEDLKSERGIDVSYETIRCWTRKFGRQFGRNLRNARPGLTGRWHLDEMVVKIGGQRMYLWRAVDDEGEVLDMLVQKRRNKQAALRLLRKLLKRQGIHPKTIVTDGLASYGAATHKLGCSDRHRPGRLRENFVPRTPICQFAGGNESSSGSNRRAQLRGFSPPMPPSTTPSVSNVI